MPPCSYRVTKAPTSMFGLSDPRPLSSIPRPSLQRHAPEPTSSGNSMARRYSLASAALDDLRINHWGDHRQLMHRQRRHAGFVTSGADVGRSTFYAHFRDKDELFIRHTVVFGRALGGQLSWDDTRTKCPVRSPLDVHRRH